MQWLIDIVYEKVVAEIGIPPVYINRGDPGVWDFVTLNFTTDGAWHELDLSALVPAAAEAVMCRLVVICAVVNPGMLFRPAGQVGAINSVNFSIPVAGLAQDRSITITLDSARHVEYLFGNFVYPMILMAVRGWWL